MGRRNPSVSELVMQDASPQYRTYAKDWTPTGHADAPQYPGQVPIGGWQDEGDMYAVEQPMTGRLWLRALKIIGAILVVYVLLVSALVLVGA